MKILHFTNRFLPSTGGMETVVESLCRELKKKGIKSDVLTLETIGGKKFPKEETVKGIKIFRIPSLNLKYYHPSVIPWGLIQGYDIIHIHSMGFLSDMLLLTKPIHKKKIIISTHGGIFHTQNIRGIKQLYFNTIEKWLFHNADRIIAVSKQDQKTFSKISNNITLIENGFNPPKLRGKKEKNTFLFVGRLSKNKGIERLIEVVSKIGGNYKLWIVGKDFDNLSKNLQNEIKRLNCGANVELLGGISPSELDKLYSKAEFFVSASKYEGFGITAIEAMYAKCIPILNDIPTFRDFCARGRGHVVDFYKNDAPNIFVRAINNRLNNNYSVNANTFAKSFLWRNKVKEFIEVYNSLLTKHLNK